MTEEVKIDDNDNDNDPFDSPDINYIFQLFDCYGEYLDETSLVENDPSHAYYLFMEEFGWQEKLGRTNATVKLISFDDPTLIDHPEKLMNSSDVHPKGLRLCSCDSENKQAIKELESCPDFRFEDEADEIIALGGNITCANCLAFGFKSVCEAKPKEVK